MDPLLVLTILCSAAELFALWQFVRARVHRLLPWFSIYILAGVVQSFAWLAGSPTTKAYTTVYGLTTPVIVGLQLLVFVELWRKLLTRYSSADRAGKALGIAIIGASTALGLLTGIDGLALHWGISRRMLFMWIFWGVRYSATVLCIASSLLAVCASLFEQKIPRYVSVHAYLLALYFGSIAAGYLTYNLKLLSAETAGVFMVGSAAGLYVLWGLLMTGSTEAAPAADTDPARDGAEGREPQANGLGKQVA